MTDLQVLANAVITSLIDSGNADEHERAAARLLAREVGIRIADLEEDPDQV